MPSPASPQTDPSGRAIQRERERVARQRRAVRGQPQNLLVSGGYSANSLFRPTHAWQDKLENMRATHNSLQAAVLAMHTLNDPMWERFLNPDALRMRMFLKTSQRLARDEAALRHEQAQLRRQLAEQQLPTQVVAQLIQNRHVTSPWKWKLERLSALQRGHYRPWTLEECQDEIDKALKVISAFEWSTEKQTTGVSFLGWREYRRLDAIRDVLQFQFHKTFRGYDVMDYVNTMWDAYTDPWMCQRIVLGPRLVGQLEIIQQLGPNTVIVRLAERFPTIDVDIHVVYLVFRMRTDRGFTQIVRTICCPELIKMTALEWPNDLWPSNFVWFQWELLDDDEQGYDARASGSVGSSGISYMSTWMWEAFGCALRSEQQATRKLLIRTGD